MSVWLWLNLGVSALFVLAIVGVPVWLVVSRPDHAPTRAELPAWRRAREQRARQLAAARQRAARQPSARRWSPAAGS